MDLAWRGVLESHKIRSGGHLNELWLMILFQGRNFVFYSAVLFGRADQASGRRLLNLPQASCLLIRTLIWKT